MPKKRMTMDMKKQVALKFLQESVLYLYILFYFFVGFGVLCIHVYFNRKWFGQKGNWKKNFQN